MDWLTVEGPVPEMMCEHVWLGSMFYPFTDILAAKLGA